MSVGHTRCQVSRYISILPDVKFVIHHNGTGLECLGGLRRGHFLTNTASSVAFLFLLCELIKKMVVQNIEVAFDFIFTFLFIYFLFIIDFFLMFWLCFLNICINNIL